MAFRRKQGIFRQCANSVNKLMLIILSVFWMTAAPHEASAGQDGNVKRIGYIERGTYWVFTDLMKEIKAELDRMGWKNRIVFPPDAHFSPGWEPEKRSDLIRDARTLMKRKDLNLIIVAGTDATDVIIQENNRQTPIVAIAVTDPVTSGFIVNENDSGIDNLTVRVEPDAFTRMFKSFYEVVGFKKMGLMYTDTKSGRQYANVDIARRIAQELKFEIIEYKKLSEQETTSECFEGIEWLVSQKIDAFYIPPLICFDWQVSDVKKLIDQLTGHKIPTLAREGTLYVRAGALMGLASGFYGQAKFDATSIDRILKGAKPRSLPMPDNSPPRFSFNVLTAEKIGFTIPYRFIAISDEIFEEITLPENRAVK